MIVIPMAGLSRRFAEAGFGEPKYMLPLAGESVFAHAVRSFERYFHDTSFLFVLRDIADSARFVRAECERLGVAKVGVQVLDRETAGQAETVDRGLTMAEVGDDEAVTIFNIDTFRPGFRLAPSALQPGVDGYLEVFRGSGANWSYVRAADGPEPRVLETAEKRPLSDLCCTGLYHFARTEDFRTALEAERTTPSASELYIAPLYNHLIADGKTIVYETIRSDQVIFCGVPSEYEALRSTYTP